MSTSLLYHGWGLRGYRYRRTAFVDGGIEFMIEQNPDTLRCGDCGGRRVVRQGQVVRRFRALPIGSKPVTLVLPIQRLWCADCGKTRQVQVAFADERRSYTRAWARYALELSRAMTILDVARHLGVSWDVVKDLQKRHLQRRFKRRKLKHLKQLAVDEISIGKGQRYLTVVLDLLSGAVVFIGRGKSAAALEPFWKQLRRAGAKIEAIASDMSAAYTLAIAEHLPRAVHVFDRFHVVKLFNDKLSDLRRQMQRSAEQIEHKEVLKGTRWLLLKNPENLDEQRHERRRLEDALRLNQPLACAYYMKEDLRQFWEQPGKRSARCFLDDWIARAEVSGVRMLQKFAQTLQLHRRGLLAWYDHPISTGPLEGTNNKIKTMQRQAYGYRDQEFFKLKIFAIHEATYALVG
jgi:transposase